MNDVLYRYIGGLLTDQHRLSARTSARSSAPPPSYDTILAATDKLTCRPMLGWLRSPCHAPDLTGVLNRRYRGARSQVPHAHRLVRRPAQQRCNKFGTYVTRLAVRTPTTHIVRQAIHPHREPTMYAHSAWQQLPSLVFRFQREYTVRRA
jgi:hypothetical protein